MSITPSEEHWRRRARRPRLVRALSVAIPRTAGARQAVLEAGAAEYPEDVASERPRTRRECEDGPRPCPFASCKWHLFLEVSPKTGSIKFNFPDLEVWEMRETCTLDLAERGGLPLESVGAVMNLTRERVRQLETLAMVAIASQLRGHL